MPTPQDTKKDVMSKVNSVIAAINLYPNIDTTNTQLSFSSSANPIDLLLDFFKSTKGYDWLIEKVSEYVAYAIPVMEIAVKGILLSNIRIMLSCSVSPFITEGMIKNGIVFDINQIDLLNIFNFSPLDKSDTNIGRYYYFGCDPEDGINTIDDVKQSKDFNAVLWYSKNTPGERVVWRRNMDIGKPYAVKQKGLGWLKQVKSNGIATIEFNGRSSGLSDAEGNGGFFVQEPISNCIHLFIGNCAPLTENDHSAEISHCTRIVNQYQKLDKNLDDIAKKIDKGKRNNTSIIIENGANEDALAGVELQAQLDYDLIKKIKYAIQGIDIASGTNGLPMNEILDSPTVEFGTIHESLTIDSDLMASNIIQTQADKIDYMNMDAGTTKNYPSAMSNYYYMHPLFEWNTDYIMSMKLFDEKVVTAQLLEALTKCFSLSGSINITPQMQFVQNQLRDLVTRVIETDEGTVSDCFFSFTNDSYNHLLNEVELNRANLVPVNSQTINEVPSAEDIMAGLNSISHDASKEELKSAISSSLFSATSSTKPFTNGPDELSLNIEANFSILDQLLTQLVYVLVSAVLQPKIYVLMMANLKFLGNDPNFDLAKFMQQFSDLISQLIKEIRDQILEYFKNELVKIIQELVKILAVRLSLEQYQYYITLLTHCLNCFKLHGNQFDWNDDNVNYADITELTQEQNQEC